MSSVFDMVAGNDLARLEAALAADPASAAARHDSGASLLAWSAYMGNAAAVALVRGHLPALDPYEAIIVGDAAALEAALAAGWDADALSPDGFTALSLAAFFGNDAAFDRLLPLTGDVDRRAENRQQVAAIHAATARRTARMVEALLRAGANPDLAQQDGFTPLIAAAQHGDAVIAGLLVLFGADRELASSGGTTPAAEAEKAGHAWLAACLG
jgi:ankyrin repeat protein